MTWATLDARMSAGVSWTPLESTSGFPRARQLRFFYARVAPAMGDEEARISNTAPGFLYAESESPTLIWWFL